ncbi:MAG: helix-turn-helix domain-containing protein [Lachnospira sp.]
MLKDKGISSYKLENIYGINPSIINRLRHDHNFNIGYLDYLCELFDCEIGDIVEHVKHHN